MSIGECLEIFQGYLLATPYLCVIPLPHCIFT